MTGKAETLEIRRIYEGRVVDLAVEQVRLPNGSTTELEIIRHRGAVAVVPVDAEGIVHLVRQYRHAVGGWLLEVPAGKLEPGESPPESARREVEEETGYRAGALLPLGSIWTTPGFTDERIWLFAATELERGRQELEQDEALTVESVPLRDAVEMAVRGEICDSKSVVALVRAERLLGTVGDRKTV